MAAQPNVPDSNEGLQPKKHYYIRGFLGEGRIGRVYRAERADPEDVLACKIIPEGRLRKGWERELQKLTKLRGVPHVVQYYDHGTDFDGANRPYIWVMFQ